jgi:hypothetical protein
MSGLEYSVSYCHPTPTRSQFTVRDFTRSSLTSGWLKLEIHSWDSMNRRKMHSDREKFWEILEKLAASLDALGSVRTMHVDIISG